MDRQDVLAAGLLATLHHEMSVSASAAPLAFNALDMSTSANNGVSSAVCSGILNGPDVRASVPHTAMLSPATTLANFPCIESFTAHEARTLRGPHNDAMLKNVENGHAKRISSAACDMEVSSSHLIKG